MVNKYQRIVITPCVFLIDRYDGAMVAVTAGTNINISEQEYFLGGIESEPRHTKKEVEKRIKEFEEDFPNTSYTVKLYTNKGVQASRRVMGNWDGKGFRLYLNCEGRKNEI